MDTNAPNISKDSAASQPQDDNSLYQMLGIAATASLAIFMVNLDTTVVNIILPELSDLFVITTNQTSLIILSYLLAVTGTALIFGRLSDMKSPERIFLCGYAIFIIGSGLCATAWNLETLSIFRFIQGIGGAMIFATNAVIVIRYLPLHVRGRAFAVNGMMAGMGFALGSPIGGFLSHHFGWRMVFLINIPVGLIGVWLGMRFLSWKKMGVPRVKFDTSGAITSFLCLATLVLALHTWEEIHRISPMVLLSLITSLVFGVLFVSNQHRTEYPLLNLIIFKNRALNFALAGTSCYYILLQGLAFVFPFYFIESHGYSPLAAGNLLFISPIVSLVLTPFVGWVSDRVGSHVPSIVGATIFVFTSILFLFLTPDSSLLFIVACLLVYGLALAFYCAPILTLTMTHAQAEVAGIVSSVKSVIPSIFGMIGVGVYASLYCRMETDARLIPPETAQQGFQFVILLSLGVSIICLISTLLTKEGRTNI